MASIRRVGDQWRAEIARAGVRESKRFESKREAEDWAIARESEILSGEHQRTRQTLASALDKIDARNKTDATRARIARRYSWADTRLDLVTPATIAAWRDERLQEVSASTVRREMNYLASVLKRARLEWGWISKDPLAGVRKPSDAPHRERLISTQEIDAMLVALQYAGEVKSVAHEVAVALLLTVETGMRAGELTGLQWSDIDGRVARLAKTKNGSSRSVPLSTRAEQLLDVMRRKRLLHVRGEVDSSRVFHIDAGELSTIFRRARKAAGLGDFRFHDGRATAVTRLATRLSIHDLARMIGHQDLNSLLVYYREPAESIADKLG